MSEGTVIAQYLKYGFTHVIPWGYDHLLFMVAIFFYSSRIRTVVVQCSIFTVAHSLTLFMTAKGIILQHAAAVEPVIALSIMFTALGNILQVTKSGLRMLIVFAFGLIHGMGFAAAINSLGIPANHFLSAILSFNLGVEMAQLTVVFSLHLLVTRYLIHMPLYQKRVVYPVSAVIACIGLLLFLFKIGL
jgi:HupE / UreJ protein